MAAEEEFGTLTCPECGHKQTMPIPTTSCIPFYQCNGCGQLVFPREGVCCVFCSYADKPCPVGSGVEPA